jgi:hypothetical protein
VIHIAGVSGAAQIDMRRELGEWGAREMALATPDPRTKATPFATRTGRSPAVTIAWARPLCATRNAVQYLTGGVR